MSEMQFPWNLPYEVDASEPEIKVIFCFSPGSKGWHNKRAGDPDCNPPCVEDIRYTNPATGLIEHPEEGSDFLHELAQACWDYAEAQENDRD